MPAVPAAGVPLRTPVAELNVTPLGSAPLSLNVGGGLPVAVTGNEPAEPTVNVVLVPLVKAGADSARKLTVTVPVELLFTISVQLAVGLEHVTAENCDGRVQLARRLAFRVTVALFVMPDRLQEPVPVVPLPLNVQLIPLGVLLVTAPGLDPEKVRFSVTESVNVFCACDCEPAAVK